MAPEAWMFAGALAFAAMGGMTHALGSRCDWALVAFIRVAVMFVAAVGLARLARVRLVAFRPRILWLRSLAGSTSLLCNFYAMANLPVATALTLMNTYPIWVVAISALVLRVPPTRREFAGIVCGMVGVALIQPPGFGAEGVATAVALAGAIFTAMAFAGLHRLGGVDPRAVVAHFAGVATLVTAVALLTRLEAFTPSILKGETPYLLLGVAATGTIGQLCLTRAYASGSPSRMAAIGLSQVVFALAIDLTVWGRRLTTGSAIGFALVLAPAAWLGARSGRRLAPAEARLTEFGPSHPRR